ncbi:V-type ATPase 116kDa subunit family protein [Cryobacterium sp. MLB-32]|uniref:V-type ATPase 116kDa subunit family protein n=1 Tax=Cryobacterium sp. MLB-32 TaxID=1529318 RepID=UPI0009DE53AD|nr:V-type ATPase 116kDa subunit family protein [Cryobacterium sp. MLB-32]
MRRVAIVAPRERSREVLTAVAQSGVVELDLPVPAAEGLEEMERVIGVAVASDGNVGWVGWTPVRDLVPLTDSLTALDAAVVPLARPRGIQPPTLQAGKPGGGMSRTLVDTYGTVPYADVDPSRLAGLAYVVMFGMMFGDLGHGAILLVIGLILGSGQIRRLRNLKRAWLFVAGAGLAAMIFGALYGQAFGPTGLIPVLWLDPLSNPIPVLTTAVIFGAILLAGAYALGTINRVREGGWGFALYASSGVAGSVLFLSLGLLVWGAVAGFGIMMGVSAVLAAAALVFIFIGFFVEAGGGATGVVQAGIELVDAVIRLGSNVVSFARLAAFGLTHAALLAVVWTATTGLWSPGWGALAAIVIFLVGNVLTFALEALVSGVQALRLEYYELFSRIFQSEGQPFRPWAPDLTNDLAEVGSDHHPTSPIERPPT